MRIHFVLAPVFALAVAVHGYPASQIPIDQDVPAIQASAACAQDFPSAASPDSRATVVMCGLDSPRGLAFSDAAVFVVEAGSGGLGRTPTAAITRRPEKRW